jgi:hypothetical protein
MYASVRQALDRIFAGVAAIRTYNDAGEIHYHVHVLVGKVAENRKIGRVVSLSSAAGGGTGRRRVREPKSAWKEALDKEFKERLGLTTEQRAPNAAPALTLPDGTRLEFLNRANRRLHEKDLAPWYAVPDKSGAPATSGRPSTAPAASPETGPPREWTASSS